MSLRRGFDDSGRIRLAQALEALEDAIALLEWRYAHEAGPSVARLEQIREELRMALVLAGGSASPLH